MIDIDDVLSRRQSAAPFLDELATRLFAANEAPAQGGRGATTIPLTPGNRLETLKRNRTGQHSIRINDQWRICFVWTQAGPINVEISDYH